MKKVMKLYFDGASKLNGSVNQIAGCGWYAESEKGNYGGFKFIGHATNNEAEYQGLINGLRSITNKDQEIEVYGDSMLVIQQMQKKWQIKAQNLLPLWEEAQELIKEFKKVYFFHIDRELNSRADTMANNAIKFNSLVKPSHELVRNYSFLLE